MSRFLRECNCYKITGIVSFLAGGGYVARAFRWVRAPGAPPVTNTYPVLIGILLCVSALGVYIFGAGKKSDFYRGKTHLLVVPCFIIFTLMFEKTGAVKASFILSFIMGVIWNHNPPEASVQVTYLTANKRNMAENILVSCASAAGVWLIFEKIFGLSLP